MSKEAWNYTRRLFFINAKVLIALSYMGNQLWKLTSQARRAAVEKSQERVIGRFSVVAILNTWRVLLDNRKSGRGFVCLTFVVGDSRADLRFSGSRILFLVFWSSILWLLFRVSWQSVRVSPCSVHGPKFVLVETVTLSLPCCVDGSVL